MSEDKNSENDDQKENDEQLLSEEEKTDETIEESFPASDPPPHP